MAGNGHRGHATEHQCCGVVQQAATDSRDRRNRRREKPQSWIVLKLTIGVTLGIIGYASYVYIGRFCEPMIRRNQGALGGRNFGIPFLVVFCILLVMMVWAYVMVITTSPGKAGQHVGPSEPPAYDNPVPRWWDAEDEIGGGPYQYAPEGTNQNGGSSGLPTKPSPARLAEKGSQQDYNTGDTDAIPPVAAVRTRAEVNGNEAANVPPNQTNGNQNTSGQLPMMFSRSPPQTPVLRPEFRYCQRDGFIKPLRAHHCRACGTCILKYDHHCPWIGQCVGAHNHKFFVHFCQWAAIFCMWTFSTLVAGTVKMSKNGGDVDAQTIVIIALSALFILFTTVLLITHIRLIILNQSTVDSLKAQHMKEREKSVLARMHSWYQFGARQRTKKQWDQEWGDIDTEGNIWWLGSSRKNWEAVMGPSIWGWFLPIGHTPTDGVNWPINPRFDSEGRWRPRQEWPAELR